MGFLIACFSTRYSVPPYGQLTTFDVDRYDGLTPALFEQYVVDLILFGVNQIELITGSFDDAPYSPHFALSHDDMNVAMSTILAKYHINVSLW